ncbi:thiamine pyrophosphokinase- protein [Ophiocordyceps camponoti-floridani]|uniref:Thiamine pyrophosphokinase- protein n=1 Tax=Ophiocordyceps camponoti-floridani TaxID=2030778 RepID=A0A8H4Q238_9HYPO|nr:thiamine pyrophosphokinase- protein [Ophiocordyceps camponoti-floridani]
MRLLAILVTASTVSVGFGFVPNPEPPKTKAESDLRIVFAEPTLAPSPLSLRRRQAQPPPLRPNVCGFIEEAAGQEINCGSYPCTSSGSYLGCYDGRFSQLAAACVDYQASRAGECPNEERRICCNNETLSECHTYLTTKADMTLTFLGCDTVGGTGHLLSYNPKSFTFPPGSSISASTTKTRTMGNQDERTTDSSDDRGGGSKVGAIVGGVVGGVAALALIALVTVLLLRHRKRRVEKSGNPVLQVTGDDAVQ